MCLPLRQLGQREQDPRGPSVDERIVGLNTAFPRAVPGGRQKMGCCDIFDLILRQKEHIMNRMLMSAYEDPISPHDTSKPSPNEREWGEGAGPAHHGAGKAAARRPHPDPLPRERGERSAGITSITCIPPAFAGAAMIKPCVDRVPPALHTPALSASLLSPQAFARRAMEPGYGARCRPARPHEGVAGALAGATTTVGTVSSAFPHPFSRKPRVGRRVP
jgi:hypothetical protein